MKNILISIGLLGIFAISCNQMTDKNKKNQDIEKIKQDSINNYKAEQNRIEKAKQDSIISMEQNKVIGEIMFGMTEKEVKSKIKIFREENRRPDKFLGEPYYDDYIGEYEYFQIIDLYDEGKLYELFINGKLTHWEDYDKLVPKQINSITNVIMQKYGPPNLQNEIIPRYKLQKGYSYLINRWIVGKKTIEISVEDKGTRYPVNISIFLPEIRDKIKRQKEQKEIESTEKAKDIF